MWCSYKAVSEEDSKEFQRTPRGPIRTNSSSTRMRVEDLMPYTVYTFQVQAANEVGVSRASKQSYPAITLMESKNVKLLTSS